MVLDSKLNRIRSILKELRRVAVAFSGGVDSTFVLKLAADTLGPSNVVAVTGKSASLAADELNQAATLAKQFGVEHVILDTDEFENENYLANPVNRCYFCKTTLYAHMQKFIASRGLTTMINGTNADDLGDYRPGLDAAREFNVRAPLAEAGLTKAEIRELSARFGLPTADKPAMPCLSSRVQYGETITPEKLRMIEAAEKFLRDELGIAECRVRHHHNIARIEVPPPFIPRLADPTVAARIDHHFRSLGYAYVTLDLRGFRSGSLNEVVSLEVRMPQAKDIKL
jgi:uncharacterized protein